MVLVCLPLAVPIGLSPLLILTLCRPERVLVVSTEPPDDLSCLTTPGVGCPGERLLPVPLTRCRGGGGPKTACSSHRPAYGTPFETVARRGILHAREPDAELAQSVRADTGAIAAPWRGSVTIQRSHTTVHIPETTNPQHSRFLLPCVAGGSRLCCCNATLLS